MADVLVQWAGSSGVRGECSRAPLLLAAALALCLIAGTAAAVPAVASPTENPSPAPAPTVTLVPATDHDLPLGRVTMGPTASKSSAVSPDASWSCSIFASDPQDYGVDVAGTGWQSCTGTCNQPQEAIVQVQRETGFLSWTNAGSDSTGWTTADRAETTAYGTCVSGTYRIVTTGLANGGAYDDSVQSLNYLDVSC